MAVGLMRLRTRPQYSPAYRVWGYPMVPALFVAGLSMLVLNTIVERPRESVIGVVLVALGLPAYCYWRTNNPD